MTRASPAGNAANTVIRGHGEHAERLDRRAGLHHDAARDSVRGPASLGADVNAKLAACAATPDRSDLPGAAQRDHLGQHAAPADRPGRPGRCRCEPHRSQSVHGPRQPGRVLQRLRDLRSHDAPPHRKPRSARATSGVGSYSCSNALTVAIDRGPPTARLATGSPREHPAAPGWTRSALPDRPDTAQHFRVTPRQARSRSSTCDMTLSPVMPQMVVAWARPTRYPRRRSTASRSPTGPAPAPHAA